MKNVDNDNSCSSCRQDVEVHFLLDTQIAKRFSEVPRL